MSQSELEDRERKKAANHQYYLSRRQAALRYQALYDLEHKEKIREYQKKYREARRKVKKRDASKTEKGSEE